MRLFRKKMRVPAETNGDALVAIAQEDPGALKLVGDIVERNAVENTRVMEEALETERARCERLREDLVATNRELSMIHRRINWLLGGPTPFELRDEIEEIVEQALEQERQAQTI